MRHHLVSDVPVVLFLSGGTDSACLAAAARQAGAQNLTAMTVGFAEEEFDESELSQRTARALDIPHRIVTLPAEQIRPDRKSTRLNSSHVRISYAVFCLKKKKKNNTNL